MKRTAFLVIAAAGLTGSGLAPAASTSTSPVANPAVISDWNAIAQRTIFTEGLTPVPRSTLYFGFVSTAVYDAVVAIKGRYQPYVRQPRPRAGASAQAAAVTAAYTTLRHYFPTSADALAADYATSMGAMPAGAARDRGVEVGRAAAASMIRLRAHDGRNAEVTLNVPVRPGVWRPTPEAFAPMLPAELGFVRPMLLRRPTQFAPPGPDPITSARYARDFREVKRYGALEGSLRSAAQTETALFFADNAVAQYQTAMRDQVSRRGLNIVDAARMFAIVGATAADAAIGCFRSKYDNAYWRPITAIREADTDRNPATGADADWSPLVATPPYPEYTSGHACVTGSFSNGLSYLFGAANLDLTVSSAVTGTTRHYPTANALDRDTQNARIWLGLHFRKAMTDGRKLGHDVSGYGVRNFFRPVH